MYHNLTCAACRHLAKAARVPASSRRHEGASAPCGGAGPARLCRFVEHGQQVARHGGPARRQWRHPDGWAARQRREWRHELLAPSVGLPIASAAAAVQVCGHRNTRRPIGACCGDRLRCLCTVHRTAAAVAAFVGLCHHLKDVAQLGLELIHVVVTQRRRRCIKGGIQAADGIHGGAPAAYGRQAGEGRRRGGARPQRTTAAPEGHHLELVPLLSARVGGSSGQPPTAPLPRQGGGSRRAEGELADVQQLVQLLLFLLLLHLSPPPLSSTRKGLRHGGCGSRGSLAGGGCHRREAPRVPRCADEVRQQVAVRVHVALHTRHARLQPRGRGARRPTGRRAPAARSRAVGRRGHFISCGACLG
mmetsp:Transcript_14577/g.37395  ORF Transcript_14577/g.37395 Transcript_14577/m.37395 type:complete len:361 (+) Transcript_14577:161-1243(+)